MSNMRKKHYLCTAEQEMGAKAYASAPDKDKVSHRGTPCLAEQKSGGSANPACVSVNKNSVAKALVSMISVWQN